MKCKRYPLNAAAPPAEFSEQTRPLVTEDQFCRFPSLQCFPRWTSFTLILCGVCLSSREPSLSDPEPALFPDAPLIPKEGFRHTISHGDSTISDAAVGDLQGPNQHPPSSSIAYSIPPPFENYRTKFGSELPNNYYLQSSDVMWLSLIIHLLHHVTLVTETLLRSRRSGRDRRLNKLRTISFIPLFAEPSPHGRHLILYMCFTAVLHTPQRHKKKKE